MRCCCATCAQCVWWLTVARPELQRGHLKLAVPKHAEKGVACYLEGEYPEDEHVSLSGDDLHWLITVAGPAMLAYLGGPIAGRGIEPVGQPPPRPEKKGTT